MSSHAAPRTRPFDKRGAQRPNTYDWGQNQTNARDARLLPPGNNAEEIAQARADEGQYFAPYEVDGKRVWREEGDGWLADRVNPYVVHRVYKAEYHEEGKRVVRQEGDGYRGQRSDPSVVYQNTEPRPEPLNSRDAHRS